MEINIIILIIILAVNGKVDFDRKVEHLLDTKPYSNKKKHYDDDNNNNKVRFSLNDCGVALLIGHMTAYKRQRCKNHLSQY